MNHFIYRQSWSDSAFNVVNKYNARIGTIVLNTEQNKYGWINTSNQFYITEEQTEEILDKLKFLNKHQNLSYTEKIKLLNRD
jgi:hypothetical protein